MKTIKITGYEIDIKDSLTFGEREDIQKEMMKTAKVKGIDIEFDPSTLIDSKYSLLEKYIVKIRKIGVGVDIEEIPFSREWLRGLPEEEGQKVVDESGIYTEESKKKE